MVVSGGAFATGERWDFDSFADGHGASRVTVMFTLGTEVTYTLTGKVSAFDRALADVALLGSAGEIFGVHATGPAETLPVNGAGTLGAGDYTLEVSAEGTTFGGSFVSEYAFGEYVIVFAVVPTVCQRNCGDVDGTGGPIDLIDFAGLQDCFGESPTVSHDYRCADLAVDQLIDYTDYTVFDQIMGTIPTDPPPSCL